jgi:hypothetical protein
MAFGSDAALNATIVGLYAAGKFIIIYLEVPVMIDDIRDLQNGQLSIWVYLPITLTYDA